MINLFRNVRRKLADDNRPLKYMRYAIGEIVLVVIGILIALQINNWNEERKVKIEEQIILKDLIRSLYYNPLLIISIAFNISSSFPSMTPWIVGSNSISGTIPIL